MTQVVLTEAEATRLAEIKRTHEAPVRLGPDSSVMNTLTMAEIRHNHRGELLTMLDAVAARTRKAIDDCKAAVIDANKACQRADARSRTIAELQADLHRLRNENRDLVQVFENLRYKFDTLVAEADILRSANHTLTGQNKALREHHGKIYIFDVGTLGAEAAEEKPSFYIKRADAHKYTVETKELPARRLDALLHDINNIAIIANRAKA